MKTETFHEKIFSWFKKYGRVLPWREKLQSGKKQRTASLRDEAIVSYFANDLRRDPYRIVVSELMLQQTQVDRVLPKFEAFIAKWPTQKELSQAKLSEVLIMWQGLGYNRRALYLHQMAKKVMTDHRGIFPQDENVLKTLPGIGEYTARAILAFAYGKDVGVIDTNIQRIFARTKYGVEQNEVSTRTKISQKEFIQVVDAVVPLGKGDPWNQALMDFGALVCTARSPKCEDCPLQEVCKANINARNLGFKTYAEQLTFEPIKKTIKKKSIQKFHDTDRYFRGRIVDKLREGPIHMELLHQHLEKNHGLVDKKRWGAIIERLVLDKLIAVRGSTVSLAG